MHRCISPPGAQKLQRKVHISNSILLYGPDKKQKIRGKWKNLNKKIRQCGTHIRIMFSTMHRSTLEQFSQLFIFTTTSYFISLIFFSFPESTQAFIASWYSSVLLLCFYSLLPFKDKHLTPGKQIPLISTKAKVYACL